MSAFTFVHAADLHLDAPFAGVRELLREESGAEARALRALMPRAGFVALERLVEVCLRERAAFLILAGDVYNAAEGSLKAELALRDACVSLGAAGIRVFLAHGNHDPLRRNPAVPLPENVTVFGPEPETHTLEIEGRRVSVAGVSHAREKETRNLAALFPPLPAGDFRVGALHCALSGKSGPHEIYAPCSVEDLLAVGCEYWALGHVHTRQEIRPAGASGPCIVYPGSLQGLHVRETGEHGCVLARVSGASCATEFLPLAPIRWEAPDISLEQAGDTLPDLEAYLPERLNAYRPDASAAFPPSLSPLRLTLSGRTPLHRELSRPQAAAEVRDRLNDALQGSGLWVRDLFLNTRPPLDRSALRHNEGLVGAVVRGVEEARAEQSAREAARDSLRELFAVPGFAAHIPPPDDAELDELIDRAGDLCLDLLGSEQCD